MGAAAATPPIVTTTDGVHDPVVWMLGAEGDNRLHDYQGDSGRQLFVSAPLSGLRHLQTLSATPGRLSVAVDNNVLAFAHCRQPGRCLGSGRPGYHCCYLQTA